MQTWDTFGTITGNARPAAGIGRETRTFWVARSVPPSSYPARAVEPARKDGGDPGRLRA